MTTKQFFELELPLNLTRHDMSNILDALFVTIQVYEEQGHNATAETYKELLNKMRENIHKYDELFK